MIDGIYSDSFNKIPVVIAIISTIIGFLMLFYYTKSKSLLNEMWAVDTYKARDLRLLCSSGFTAIVEAEGIIECDIPLISPAAKMECCLYHVKIEEERFDEDRNTSWNSVFEETKSTIFKVRDDTGYTLVDPQNAEIDSFRVYFDTVNRSTLQSMFGNLKLNSIGKYRVSEEILGTSGYVFVLGSASCLQSGTSPDVIIKFGDKGYMDPKKKHLIISRKSEKELAKHHGITTSICYYMAILSFLIAFISILNIAGILTY